MQSSRRGAEHATPRTGDRCNVNYRATPGCGSVVYVTPVACPDVCQRMRRDMQQAGLHTLRVGFFGLLLCHKDDAISLSCVNYYALGNRSAYAVEATVMRISPPNVLAAPLAPNLWSVTGFKQVKVMCDQTNSVCSGLLSSTALCPPLICSTASWP